MHSASAVLSIQFLSVKPPYQCETVVETTHQGNGHKRLHIGDRICGERVHSGAGKTLYLEPHLSRWQNPTRLSINSIVRAENRAPGGTIGKVEVRDRGDVVQEKMCFTAASKICRCGCTRGGGKPRDDELITTSSLSISYSNLQRIIDCVKPSKSRIFPRRIVIVGLISRQHISKY